jgi:uncharacterized membrane-anchored protein
MVPPNRHPMTAMTATLATTFASLLLFAPPAENAAPPQPEPPADAAALEGSEADVNPGEQVDEAAILEAMAAADPAQAAALEAISRISPEVMQALDAISEADLDALMEKRARGEQLSDDELALTDANISIAIAGFESKLDYQSGDVEIGQGLATLHLGEHFRYISPADAQTVLTEAWGNPPGDPSLGMIVPANVSVVHPFDGWGVTLYYSEDGHVDDDDANDIDYDELLENMQEGTEQANETRIAAGYTPMHLVGWAEPPRYDGNIKSMYWALEYRDDDPNSPNSLNYAIRVLGRKGVLELNAISFMGQMDVIKPAMEEVYALVEFKEGNRYSDFDPDVDQMAAYTLGGLIAGGVVAKSGLLKGLFALLIAGKKFVVLLVVGIGAFVMRFFGRKEEEE